MEDAGVAQLVEHHLAKVRVASSSLVSRSDLRKCEFRLTFFVSEALGFSSMTKRPGGGIGRHVPMKIGMSAND